MNNVLPLRKPAPEPEEIEADDEYGLDSAWRDLGYGRRPQSHPSPGLNDAEAEKSEFDRIFEENFGPWEPMEIPPRPPGWRPQIDPDEDLPF